MPWRASVYIRCTGARDEYMLRTDEKMRATEVDLMRRRVDLATAHNSWSGSDVLYVPLLRCTFIRPKWPYFGR